MRLIARRKGANGHATCAAYPIERSAQAALLDSGASDEDAYDAALIVGELVGNALRYAAPMPSGHLAVEWLVERDTYRIAVTDGGSQHKVRARTAAGHETTGRGLAIVAALAQDWGVACNGGSVLNTVWARGRLHQTDRSRQGDLQTTR